ncbi:MAG: hypothetical protein K8T91_00590 [Planctomycetes bacterium]|nr:hypothetical protein [Planctomycetota bacterium]
MRSIGFGVRQRADRSELLDLQAVAEVLGRTQAILHNRPVTLADLEAASGAFDRCLAELNYNPWN